MAQTDYFLKIDGIEGESKDKQHGKEIDVLSVTFGLAHSGSDVIGQRRGRVQFENVTVTKRLDKASPKLMQDCTFNRRIREVVVTMRKAGGKQEEFCKAILTDVLIQPYNQRTDGLEQIETIALNYAKIKWEYKEQSERGTVTGTISFEHDLRTSQ